MVRVHEQSERRSTETYKEDPSTRKEIVRVRQKRREPVHRVAGGIRVGENGDVFPHHESGTNFGITNHETPNPNPNTANIERTINEIKSQ